MDREVAAAAVAAVLFAIANNLQRGAAAEVPEDRTGPFALLWRLIRHPTWLIGSLTSGAAVVAQAYALAGGGVILVQAVIAGGLVVALGTECALERTRPLAGQVVGAVLVVTGVLDVIIIGKPGAPQHEPPVWTDLVVWVGVLTAVLTGLGVARRRPRGALTAAVLGGAAGVCFALEAGFLRSVALGISSFLHAPLGSLSVVTAAMGFTIASLAGTMLTQRGYQTAPLRQVLPAVAAAEPLTAFVFGLSVYGEHMSTGPFRLLAVGAGMIAMIVGVVLTARGRGERRRTEHRTDPAVVVDLTAASPLRQERPLAHASGIPSHAYHPPCNTSQAMSP
jgi:hypothetical protein